MDLMRRYNKNDRIEAIYVKLLGKGFTKEDINDVLSADRDYIKEMVLLGNDISIDGLGVFKIKKVAERKERELFSGLTQKVEKIEAVPEHSTVRFSVSKIIKKEIKEKTLGNPFE